MVTGIPEASNRDGVSCLHKRRTILGASDRKGTASPRLFSLSPRFLLRGSEARTDSSSWVQRVMTRTRAPLSKQRAVQLSRLMFLESNIIAPECRGIQGRRCNGSTKLHLRSNWADLCSRLHYPPVRISLVSAWQVKTGAEAPFSCRRGHLKPMLLSRKGAGSAPFLFSSPCTGGCLVL
jgi:hypothetical protein